jgi:hypothetical protein
VGFNLGSFMVLVPAIEGYIVDFVQCCQLNGFVPFMIIKPVCVVDVVSCGRCSVDVEVVISRFDAHHVVFWA